MANGQNAFPFSASSMASVPHTYSNQFPVFSQGSDDRRNRCLIQVANSEWSKVRPFFINVYFLLIHGIAAEL